MASQSRTPNPGASRKISFNVSEQYDIQDVVGEGAYGVVWYISSEPNHRDAEELTSIAQLCPSQAIRAEGSDQEDHSIRPLHVLLENSP